MTQPNNYSGLSAASYWGTMFPTTTTSQITTFTDTWNYTSHPCSVCQKNINQKGNMDVMFLGGFWFCDNNCRIEFIFRQLSRTESIEG